MACRRSAVRSRLAPPKSFKAAHRAAFSLTDSLTAFDTQLIYGMLCHMKAELVIRDRRLLSDGAIIEIVVWKVPKPVPPTEHGWKYRLFYGRPGQRLVGYDNERGKGDHRHLLGDELSYVFVSLEQLLDDFEADIIAMRGEPI